MKRLIPVFLLCFLTFLISFSLSYYMYSKQNFNSNSFQTSSISEIDIPLPYEEAVLGATIYQDPSPLDTRDPQWTQPTGSVRIPVLMYHNIAPVPTSGGASYRGLFVSPSMFTQQMAYLKNNNYHTLTTQEFYDYLKSGKNPPKKSVVVTFDDGTRGQYTNAYPVLKKNKQVGIYYIISDKSPITPKEIKEMSKNGMIIDSHSALHEDLKKLNDPKQLKFEIAGSKKHLEELTGQEIVSIAYPGCVSDDLTRQIVKESGYKLGFACGTTIYHYYKYRFNLSRIHIFSNMTSLTRALAWGL